MALVNWNPDVSLFPAVPSWFDDFFGEKREGMMPAVKGISIPAVNVTENDNEYKMEVAVPGFKKEDFSLEVKNGYLTISGERKEESVNKETDKYTRREFSFSTFTRSFALPDDVLDAKINARYNDGILVVNLPKTKTETADVSKKITIQ